MLTCDLLDNFYEIEPPFEIDRPRKPAISGFIVATKHMRTINGTWDIVYIDKGIKDRLEVGDVLRIITSGELHKPNGIIQIINLKDSTATAIVRTSADDRRRYQGSKIIYQVVRIFSALSLLGCLSFLKAFASI